MTPPMPRAWVSIQCTGCNWAHDSVEGASDFERSALAGWMAREHSRSTRHTIYVERHGTHYPTETVVLNPVCDVCGTESETERCGSCGS